MGVPGVVRTGLCVSVALSMCGPSPVLSAQAPAAVTRVVASHLDEALGQQEFRTVERRQITGASKFETRQAGLGELVGTFAMETTPATTHMQIDFGSPNYDGEMFEFDGAKSTVGTARRTRAQRSAFGNFMADNEVIFREGLLGGVLNAGWPLLDASFKQAKVETDGIKNFDGKSNYRLRYRAKKGQGDLNIYIYIDSRTYRHTATVYSWSRAQDIGRTIISSSQESDVYLQMEERFDDFVLVGRLTLPRSWRIDYIQSMNTSTSWRYTLKVSEIAKP